MITINNKKFFNTNDPRIFLDEQNCPYAIEKKGFWEYVQNKGLTKAQVLSLSPENKRKFFIKWKHGLDNPIANEDIESTKQYLRNLDDKENKFEKYCDAIKGEIGLGAPVQKNTKPIEQPHWND